MLLTDLITLLQEDSNGAASRNEILRLVDIVQYEMLAKDIEYMRATPDVTIDTTSGTYLYSLPDGIRSCSLVYLPLATPTYAYRTGGANPKEVCNYAVVKDPGDGGSPNVLFLEDPSSTTYYAVCYRAPSRLTNENAVLEVPDPFTTQYLRSRVMEMIEQRRYGNSVYWTPLSKQHRGEWLRWAEDNGYVPNSGTITDYLSSSNTRSSRWV